MSKSEHEYLHDGKKYSSLRKLSETIGKTVTSKNYTEFGIIRISGQNESDTDISNREKDCKNPQQIAHESNFGEDTTTNQNPKKVDEAVLDEQVNNNTGLNTGENEQDTIKIETNENPTEEETVDIEGEEYTLPAFKKYLSGLSDDGLLYAAKKWGISLYENVSHSGIRRMRISQEIQRKFFSPETIRKNQKGGGRTGGNPPNPKRGIWVAYSNEELENFCLENGVNYLHLTGSGKDCDRIQRMRLIEALNKNDITPPETK